MSDADYFHRRCREERLAAQSTPDPRIAAIHADMAVLYEAAAKIAEEPRETTAPVIPLRPEAQARA